MLASLAGLLAMHEPEDYAITAMGVSPTCGIVAFGHDWENRDHLRGELKDDDFTDWIAEQIEQPLTVFTAGTC